MPAITKTKRTYNMSTTAVDLVKHSVEVLHAAPSQDSFVEDAIISHAQRLRDAEEARLWRQAASDPVYQAEVQALDILFADDDLHAWED